MAAHGGPWRRMAAHGGTWRPMAAMGVKAGKGRLKAAKGRVRLPQVGYGRPVSTQEQNDQRATKTFMTARI